MDQQKNPKAPPQNGNGQGTGDQAKANAQNANAQRKEAAISQAAKEKVEACKAYIESNNS